MSKYNSEKAISITKWQALFSHEGSVWETDYASVRTLRIDGTPSDDLTIKRKIATYVSEIKEQELRYTHQMARSAQHQAHRPRPPFRLHPNRLKT